MQRGRRYGSNNIVPVRITLPSPGAGREGASGICLEGSLQTFMGERPAGGGKTGGGFSWDAFTNTVNPMPYWSPS